MSTNKRITKVTNHSLDQGESINTGSIFKMCEETLTTEI